MGQGVEELGQGVEEMGLGLVGHLTLSLVHFVLDVGKYCRNVKVQVAVCAAGPSLSITLQGCHQPITVHRIIWLNVEDCLVNSFLNAVGSSTWRGGEGTTGEGGVTSRIETPVNRDS